MRKMGFSALFFYLKEKVTFYRWRMYLGWLEQKAGKKSPKMGIYEHFRPTKIKFHWFQSHKLSFIKFSWKDLGGRLTQYLEDSSPFYPYLRLWFWRIYKLWMLGNVKFYNSSAFQNDFCPRKNVFVGGGGDAISEIPPYHHFSHQIKN